MIRGSCRRRLALAGVGVAVPLAFALAGLRPLPPSALALDAARSTIWLDRHGRPLAEQLSALETVARPVRLDAISPHVVLAVLAAEDRRFHDHHGVDLLATARAAWQNLLELRVVSGGSTITQQLARLLRTEEALLAGGSPPPRSLWQKLAEARLALRLELSFDKQALLEAFLNRAPFGNLAVGIEAAARRYFGAGASASSLSLAQAAFLVGLFRGPTQYDPLRRFELARARQERVLGLMLERGMVTAAQHRRALVEPIEPALFKRNSAAMHAIDLAREELAAAGIAPRGRIRLGLDARLQAEVEGIVAEQIPKVYSRGGRSAAVVVVENGTGDVLALVGAAFADNPVWGQYNAAVAVRQPGSALKPFVYAAALGRGLTAASLAADIERPYPDTWGVYMPGNYDERFHGPVRLREALAQSLNVAAVDVLFRTGLESAFRLLDAAGLKTLDRRPSYFGLGLTLGSGGVRPLDLTNAYAALARGGVFRQFRVVRAVETESAGGVEMPPPAGERILDERIAFIISDILSDFNARIPQFGDGGVLRTPYWSAVKTGTSKGFRDNWALGFTREVTVGVWVGDPAGKPMHHMSGVEGAGIIWRRVMDLASGERAQAPQPPPGLSRVRVCSVSGERLGPHCRGGLDEWFVEGTAPKEECSIHREVRLDPENRLLVPEGCRLTGAVTEIEAVYPSPFDAWALAEEAGVPERYSPRCPPPMARGPVRVELLSPAAGEVIRIDADAPRSAQALLLQARVQGGVGPVSFLVDGEPVATREAPHTAFWTVRPGRHEIRARFEPDGTASAAHAVVVY